MRHYPRKTGLAELAGLLATIFLIAGCAATVPVVHMDTISVGGADRESLAQYPKASDDATIVLNLQSNIQRTTFYIDGKQVAVGRRVKVLVNNLAHTVTAVPEGYIAKEEFIQPPYNPQSLLGFTFMIGEKLAADQRPPVREDRPPKSSPQSSDTPIIAVKTDPADKGAVDSARIEQAKKLYYEGNAFFSAKAYREAVDSYVQALNLEAKFPPLYYNLAMAQIELGRKREAIENLRRYLDLRPDAQNAAEVKELIEKLSKQSAI